jgi:beta-glucosidase
MGADGHRHVVYKEKQMVGYRYYATKEIPVLFPFGYGLSYTTFSCQNFRTTMCMQQTANEKILTHSCTIENTGSRAGKETVQLYVGIPQEGQPRMALRAFEKVSLAPGEKKEVTFSLTKKDFSTYSCEKHDFVLEPGSYDLYVGTSSQDIHHHTVITLE